MKKKFIIAGLLVTVACLTACQSNAMKQAEQEALATVEALPTNVIEDEPETAPVTQPVETQPVVSAEPQDTTPTQTPTTTTEWASQKLNSDASIEITYTNGVPDEFVLSNGLTFKQYADVMSKYEARFDTEQFRKTFSCFYGDPTYYNTLKASLTPAEMEYDLLLLTSVSWETYNHFGNLTKTVHFGSKIFYVTDFSQLGGAAGYFVWDETQLPGDTYLGYELSATGQLTPYNCTVFTDDTLAFWLTLQEEAYKAYGVANPWSDGSTQQQQTQQQPTTQQQTSSGTLSSLGFVTMRGYEAEIENALVSYFGCDISSVEKIDSTTGTYEIALITMSNGKQAKYLGGQSSKPYVYDTSVSTGNIWEAK